VSKALVVVPPSVSPATLRNIFTAFPAVVPQVIIEGLGAVVEVPEALVGLLAASGVTAVATGAIANIQSLPVAPALLPWLEAWNKLFDPAYQHMLATRADRWLTSTARCDRAVSGSPLPAQTMTLTGDVAVGILTIDGPPGLAKLSLTDIADLTLSVLHAFDILCRNAPVAAKLVFMVEPKTVTLGVEPATVPPPLADPTGAPFSEFELREAKWRDPALAALGLPAGFDGINKYRTNLVARAWPAGNPQKSIVLLLTNYNAVRFGYALNGQVVMQLSAARRGMTVTHLDRVIAHEICHLFNAPDEYGNCDPLQTFGPFGVFNGNCLSSPIATIHTPCLMAGEADDMCGFSKAHVGWAPFP
jgi:hypothetical protein